MDDSAPIAPTAERRRDARDTVFLPDTPFPMRGGLPQKEPEILARWAQAELYKAMRKARQDAGAPLFVLHDGPPYANGQIHIGHALNKILKDFVVRSRFLLGFDVDYVPGWDCHGLPIEWKIEEKFRNQGRAKGDVPKAEFRERCREFAAEWINIQREEFKRLGILGRWEDPYATMDFATEAKIVAEFHKFIASHQLYRGSKPVMWSPVERTALADAEVEYHDHVSPTVWVRFPVIQGDDAVLGAHVVIWTTTPWTMPANRAISYNPEIAYGLYEVQAMETGLAFEPWAKPGDKFLVADKLAGEVASAAKIASWTRLDAVKCEGMVCSHPLAALDAGYGFAVPLLAGDHVTDDAGTGFVHTAPGHGQDDYQVWLAHGHRDVPDTVDAEGAYYGHVPLFGGLKVLETEGKKSGKFGPANSAVMDKLIEAGTLLARGRLEHSYPHSWRSKAPVIFRNTPQWFIRMDKADKDGNTLRAKALAAIDQTAFFPDIGRNRIGSMVEGRPDWLISRQRAWGTPLAMFVDKVTGQPLNDPQVNARILAAITAEGADAWFTRPDSDFLGAGYDPDHYEKIEDILDVWFDSGCTHAFTIEDRPDSHWPADVYLEGSDQHRGWFQSSLLEACGTRGQAPYKAVITHGMTLNDKGEKMSKSLGNAIEPQSIIKDSGAEIIRLWAAMVDYTEDQRIGKQMLATTTDSYRKLRNTLRYLLGGLAGFTEAERIGQDQMPPLERYILHRLWELDGSVRKAYENFRFAEVWRDVTWFCSQDLSAFYFDIRKDSLYCDAPDSPVRRSVRTVMDLVFERLTAWLSPLAPFTTDEAWSTRFPDGGFNALRVIPAIRPEWENPAELERWRKIRGLMEAVNGHLELMRTEKTIGSSLEAYIEFEVDAETLGAFDGVIAQDVFRTSLATLRLDSTNPDPTNPTGSYKLIGSGRAPGHKCDRCWKVLTEVDPVAKRCVRCATVEANGGTK
jgi:isoleucyl-tRNA synthetase